MNLLAEMLSSRHNAWPCSKAPGEEALQESLATKKVVLSAENGYAELCKIYPRAHPALGRNNAPNCGP